MFLPVKNIKAHQQLDHREIKLVSEHKAPKMIGF